MSSKHTRRIAATAAATMPYLLAMGAFAATPAYSTLTFHETNILGTSLDLVVTAPNHEDAEKARTVTLAEIERLRTILSTYDVNTDISNVNASKEPVKVAKEVIEVLRLYQQWQIRTKGVYSAGTGELVRLWKNAEKDGHPPDPATLAAAVSDLEKPLWKIDESAHTVQRLCDQLLNIDSLGKGFIVSHAANFARAQVPSIHGILLNIGGDISASGSATSAAGVPWIVAVADPDHPEENAKPLTLLQIATGSIATSGSYERGYEVGDKKYSHLLDPRTGSPINFKQTGMPTVASATVISSDNASANALAASLCVLTPSEGLALAYASGPAECLIVLTDGTQHRSPGFKRFEVPSSTASAPAVKLVIDDPVDPPEAIASSKTDAPAKADGTLAAKADTTAAAATAADKPVGKCFPKGYQVSVTLQINLVHSSNPRPYFAVWIENGQGEYVRTLAVWGHSPKYLRALPGWWKWGQKDNQLVASITKATRPPGKYSLMWDGTDDKGQPVPMGTYKVCVNSAFWRGGHVQGAGTIVCGTAKATSSITETPQFQDVALVYAPVVVKGN